MRGKAPAGFETKQSNMIQLQTLAEIAALNARIRCFEIGLMIAECRWRWVFFTAF